MNIIIKPSETEHEDIAKDFMYKIFGLNEEQYLLTEISDLCDFFPCGIESDVINQIEKEIDNDLTINKSEKYSHFSKKLNTIWDSMIIQKIFDNYQIVIVKTTISMEVIFDEIWKKKITPKATIH